MPASMMRLLMIIGVLLCSMHLAEPASAHAAGDENSIHLTADQSDNDRGDPGSQAVHSGHHHCPVAPDLRQAANDRTPMQGGEQLFAAIASRLTSRAPPPLLDPPLA